MIRSNKELKVSRDKLKALEDAATQVTGLDEEVLGSLADDLRREISEYQAIRDGYCNVFQLASFDDLAEALMKARIARGWTQRQLAEELGVSEQMVQRDEAGAYGRAGLARLADVAEALGYQLHGVMRPLPELAIVNSPAPGTTPPNLQRLFMMPVPRILESTPTPRIGESPSANSR